MKKLALLAFVILSFSNVLAMSEGKSKCGNVIDTKSNASALLTPARGVEERPAAKTRDLGTVTP